MSVTNEIRKLVEEELKNAKKQEEVYELDLEEFINENSLTATAKGVLDNIGDFKEPLRYAASETFKNASRGDYGAGIGGIASLLSSENFRRTAMQLFLRMAEKELTQHLRQSADGIAQSIVPDIPFDGDILESLMQRKFSEILTDKSDELAKTVIDLVTNAFIEKLMGDPNIREHLAEAMGRASKVVKTPPDATKDEKKAANKRARKAAKEDSKKEDLDEAHCGREEDEEEDVPYGIPPADYGDADDLLLPGEEISDEDREKMAQKRRKFSIPMTEEADPVEAAEDAIEAMPEDEQEKLLSDLMSKLEGATLEEEEKKNPVITALTKLPGGRDLAAMYFASLDRDTPTKLRIMAALAILNLIAPGDIGTLMGLDFLGPLAALDDYILIRRTMKKYQKAGLPSEKHHDQVQMAAGEKLSPERAAERELDQTQDLARARQSAAGSREKIKNLEENKLTDLKSTFGRFLVKG